MKKDRFNKTKISFSQKEDHVATIGKYEFFCADNWSESIEIQIFDDGDVHMVFDTEDPEAILLEGAVRYHEQNFSKEDFLLFLKLLNDLAAMNYK